MNTAVVIALGLLIVAAVASMGGLLSSLWEDGVKALAHRKPKSRSSEGVLYASD